eukprot:1564630-Rhodomonas_salina.1
MPSAEVGGSRASPSFDCELDRSHNNNPSHTHGMSKSRVHGRAAAKMSADSATGVCGIRCDFPRREMPVLDQKVGSVSGQLSGMGSWIIGGASEKLYQRSKTRGAGAEEQEQRSRIRGSERNRRRTQRAGRRRRPWRGARTDAAAS